jgi:hypothetical protein
MLRITVATLPHTTTLVLEGRLSGAWVDELAACWRDVLATRAPHSMRIDMNSVTFVDAAGKTLIRALRDDGAVLVASDLLLRTIVGDVEPPGRGIKQAIERGGR